MNRCRSWVHAAAVLAGLATVAVGSAVEEEPLPLPPYVLVGTRVANEAPGGTFAMPVSGLRFEPLVDVQGRNLAEGQADVTVRGGIFENTGFRLGAANIPDPQTGHYFAELPVPPAMLEPLRVGTGLENALGGFNSTVATLAYGWRPVEPRGELALAAGGDGLVRADLYQGAVFPAAGDRTVRFDLGAGWSESDGPLADGDHEFSRVAARWQVTAPGRQTDLFAGYQDKFLGWPNLYTPFGWPETDHLKTTLVLLNHRRALAGGGELQGALLWRRNVDDYEADRRSPGAFNPFRHETRVGGGSLEWRSGVAAGPRWHVRAEALADSIESTSLTFGPFRSRSYLRLAAAASDSLAWARGRLEWRAGAAWDDDNRGGSAGAPLAELAWSGANGRAYLHYAGASQVPGYTALGSSATSGLFRGNPGLGRERSGNWEAGVAAARGDWRAQAAVFLRQDRGLVDWTFRRGVTARTANPVDIDTMGFEAVVSRAWERGRVVAGYTWLDKREDYRGAPVDASFYALNYARHRLTLAVVWQPLPAVEIRADNELRWQAPNFLRRSGDRAWLASVGVHWFPTAGRRVELSLLVENLADDDFEEVPAVPAAPRQFAGGVTVRW